MKPEAQRIAIAIACGWKYIEDHCYKNISFMGSQTWGEGWKSPVNGKVYDDFNLPKYLTSLDAMHTAEKTLHGKPGYHSEKWASYERHLYDICNDIKGFGPYHATAAQRAEAFLRTLNLWRDAQ